MGASRNVALLCAAAAAAFLVAGVAQPRGVTVIDEVDYLTEAQALAAGADLRDRRSYLPRNGGAAWVGPRYPLGWPLLRAPFVLASKRPAVAARAPVEVAPTRVAPPGTDSGLQPPGEWPLGRAPFLANLLLHLLGAAVLAHVLRRRGLSRRWALLYLLQPTLLVFSGTLMAEPLAALHTALLLAVACEEQPLLLGFVAGLAPWLKLSQVIVCAPFVLVRCLRAPARLRALSLAAAGAALPLLAFVAVDLWLYVSPLGPGQPGYAGPLAAAGWGALELGQLAVAWPLLPLAALAARREEWVAAAACVIFFASYDSARYDGTSLAATLVIGARLLAPAIVLLLPGYAALLSRLPRRAGQAAFAALLAASVALPLLVFPALSRRRVQLAAIREALLSSLRPGCAYVYQQDEVRKLLVPWPPDAPLFSIADPRPASGCVLPLEHGEVSTNVRR